MYLLKKMLSEIKKKKRIIKEYKKPTKLYTEMYMLQ